MSKRPVVVGLSLCEKVVVEEGTHNLTLVNCFHRRNVDQLPSEPLTFFLVANITDGQGEMTFEVRIEHIEDEEAIYTRAVRLDIPNSLEEYRFRLRVRDLSFTHVGRYDIVLLIDNEIVAQRVLEIYREDHNEQA